MRQYAKTTAQDVQNNDYQPDDGIAKQATFRIRKHSVLRTRMAIRFKSLSRKTRV